MENKRIFTEVQKTKGIGSRGSEESCDGVDQEYGWFPKEATQKGKA